MEKDVPKVKVTAGLGSKIPGDGTVYVNQSPDSPLIGECIYCGSTSELSDEHTIPYSLNGIAKLKSASCRSCARETQRLEQRILRDTFGQVREYLSLPSRKARKDGRWKGVRTGTDPRSGERATVSLEDGVVLLVLPFPNYPARLLCGRERTADHDRRDLCLIPINPVDRPLPPEFEDGWTRFRATDLERCIAKIALGETIRLADNSFRDAELARFILTGDGDSSEFVGAAKSEGVGNVLHHFSLHKLTPLSGQRRSDHWLAGVRLFAFLPTPDYHVFLRSNP